jgi:hypothetical protein
LNRDKLALFIFLESSRFARGSHTRLPVPDRLDLVAALEQSILERHLQDHQQTADDGPDR